MDHLDQTPSQPSDDTILLNNPPPPPSSRHHSPTSKTTIQTLPSITITSQTLHVDPVIPCAICKDHFMINDQVKQLPCKHMYHPDCILPWLSQRRTCPVCRYKLPKESVVRRLKKIRRRPIGDSDRAVRVFNEVNAALNYDNLSLV